MPELADAAFEAALCEIRPGGDEARILACVQGAVGEGDDSGNPLVVGSGPGPCSADNLPAAAGWIRYA